MYAPNGVNSLQGGLNYDQISRNHPAYRTIVYICTMVRLLLFSPSKSGFFIPLFTL